MPSARDSHKTQMHYIAISQKLMKHWQHIAWGREATCLNFRIYFYQSMIFLCRTAMLCYTALSFFLLQKEL